MNLDQLIEDLRILQQSQPGAAIAMHSGGLFVGNYKPELLTPEELARLQSHHWTKYQDSWYLENP